jgi:hypothetical protein
MRILIIAMGRSGGYSLINWIGSEKGYQTIHEPTMDNGDILSIYKMRLLAKNKNNTVVKYLISEIENELDTFNWSNWDKIIGLIRNDTRECAISHCWALSSNIWRDCYEISNEWIVENEEEIKEEESRLQKNKEVISNIPQIELLVSYENIYCENLYKNNTDIDKLTQYLEIKKINSYSILDNRNRLRNTIDIKTKQNLI